MRSQNKWVSEPDLARLHRARQLLSSEPTRGLIELRSLADGGSGMAMIYMAEACRYGKGTGVDLADAEYWYRRAVEKGELLAYYFLGRFYLDTKRYEEAKKVFETAAAQNYAPAIHMLGRMYFTGRSVEKDVPKAQHLFELAAKGKSVPARGALAHLLIRNHSGIPRKLRGIWLLICAWASLVMVVLTEGPSSDRLR